MAIIGAGQAGLSTSWFLKQAGVDHVVIEAGRVAEAWRSRRWDSFCLVTPNWTVMLPGGRYDGPEPDGFMLRDELVRHFERWAGGFDAPVLERCSVTALDSDRGAFVLTTPDGKIQARTVVVASGGYQRAYRPAGADQIPEGVDQLLAEEYSCPDALEPGAVLIIGSGQTGCQLAEELHRAGRKVFISCGRCIWAPRKMGDRDFVWWALESGFVHRTPDMLPAPTARLGGNFQCSGRDGGHSLNFRVLQEMGVELIGRFTGAEDGSIHFADDLAQSVDFSDDLARGFMKYVAAYCERSGVQVPWEVPGPLRVKTRTSLDLAREDIKTVIWTSGYRPAYGWVHFPVFDDMGFPVQVDGRTSVPGLYFMGTHWLRKGQSATLYGVEEDAEVVATHIVENRR